MCRARPFRSARRLTLTALACGFALSTTLLLRPVPATTVIGEPSGLPPRQTVAEATTALLHSAQLIYVTHCLAPLIGTPTTPYIAKICGTVELLLESIRHEQSRVCALPDPAVHGVRPGCPTPDGVAAPWTEQVE